VAPGAIKTDMFAAVAREYIPGGEKFTDQQVDEVCGTGGGANYPSPFVLAR